MWRYDYDYAYENVDKKSDTASEKDRNMRWRDRCHNKSEATIDNDLETRLADGNSQHNKAEWLTYRGRATVLSGMNHGDSLVQKSWCGNCVAIAGCEALYERSGDSWFDGLMRRDARLERDRGDDCSMEVR